MTYGLSRILCGLLLLVILFSGIEASFAAVAHADHSATHEQPLGGDEPDDADHVDHCCHLAGHLVGIILELPVPDLNLRNDVGSRLHSLRLGVRAPPPLPPPTI